MTTLSQSSAILLSVFLLTCLLRYGFHFGMARLLTTGQYGMLGVGEGLLAIMMVFSCLGFPWTVTKFVADGRHDVLKSALLGNLLLAGLVSSLLYLGFKLGFINLEAYYEPILLLIITATMVTAAGSIYGGTLRGLFRFKQFGVTGAAQALALVVAGFSLVYWGLGAIGAMAGYALGGFVSAAIALYYVRGFKVWHGAWMSREVYLFTLPLLLGIVGTQLLMNIDILGIKAFSLGASDVMAGYYKAVLVLARIPVLIVTAMMGAFLPFMSRYSDDKERVKMYSLMMIKYVFIFILPVYLALFTIPSQIITLIFPDAYAGGGDALRIISVGMFLLALITILATSFQAVAKPELVAMILAPAVALQVALLYLFIPKYGLVGAAAATTLSCVLGLSALLFKYARAFSPGVSFSGIASLIVACLLQGGLLMFFPTDNKLMVLVSLVVSYALYLLALSLFRFLNSVDVQFIFSGILPENSKLLKRMTRVIARLNSIGGQH